MSATEARARVAEYMARILRHLRTAGKSCMSREIASALGIKVGTVRNLLITLQNEGRAEHLGYSTDTPNGDRVALWVWVSSPEEPEPVEVGEKAPGLTFVNGSQPNGDLAYWQAFERNRLTPARRELV